jgi:hypothetical protein
MRIMMKKQYTKDWTMNRQFKKIGRIRKASAEKSEGVRAQSKGNVCDFLFYQFRGIGFFVE